MSFNQTGKGFYKDVGNGEIGGKAIVKSYDDFAPPIFVGKLSSDITNNSNILDKKFVNIGELSPDIIQSSNILDKKIVHITKYIQSGGKHKLPKYVLKDLHK